MGEQQAVWRRTHEIDPVLFNSAPNTQKLLFIWGMENILRGAGATEVYFNTHATNTSFQQFMESFGASRLSTEPEYRYKITL